MFITVDASAADVAKVTVNTELAAQYAAAFLELAKICGKAAAAEPKDLARFPDVLTVTKADEDLETVSRQIFALCWTRRWPPIIRCVPWRGGSWRRILKTA